MEEEKEIKMVYEHRTESPVKSACVMADGAHMCTGSFDGSLFKWNIQVHILNIISFIYSLFFFDRRHFNEFRFRRLSNSTNEEYNVYWTHMNPFGAVLSFLLNRFRYLPFSPRSAS